MTNVLSRDSKAAAAAPPAPAKRKPILVEFWSSAVGKKWVMAVTGILLLGFVFGHMLGNLKMYQGPDALNGYAKWLTTVGKPVLPEYGFLWIFRTALIVAIGLHIIAAYQLTIMNRRARPVRYTSHRDYIAANFASRTMRWTGIIVLLFILWHIADLTTGWVNPDFVAGEPYENLVASFERPWVAALYIVANIALAFHIFHGAWSMFQSLGINNPRWNPARRWFAAAFAAAILVGNLSFPIAVLSGVVSNPA